MQTQFLPETGGGPFGLPTGKPLMDRFSKTPTLTESFRWPAEIRSGNVGELAKSAATAAVRCSEQAGRLVLGCALCFFRERLHLGNEGIDLVGRRTDEARVFGE